MDLEFGNESVKGVREVDAPRIGAFGVAAVVDVVAEDLEGGVGRF